MKNPTDEVAFFIELSVIGSQSGASILPIFWDDNYISLLPGEHKQIKGHFSIKNLNGDKPEFKMIGWNLQSDN